MNADRRHLIHVRTNPESGRQIVIIEEDIHFEGSQY